MEENDNNDDNNIRKKDITEKVKSKPLPFGSEENMITVLNTLFRHGHEDLPFNIIPGMSRDEFQSEMDLVVKSTDPFIKNKPSIVDWLRSGLFKENECNVPLALLYMALYEQDPLPDQENKECNFRELYYFLYKMTTNQTAPQLSHDSAIVLHKLLSEIIEKVWPSTQPELLRYLGKIYTYSRSPIRRTYSRKKLVSVDLY